MQKPTVERVREIQCIVCGWDVGGTQNVEGIRLGTRTGENMKTL